MAGTRKGYEKSSQDDAEGTVQKRLRPYKKGRERGKRKVEVNHSNLV